MQRPLASILDSRHVSIRMHPTIPPKFKQQFHELDAYVWARVMNPVWVPMVAPWGLPLPNFFMIHMTTWSLRGTKIRQMCERPTEHRL